MSHNKLKERVYITGAGCSRFGDQLNTPELKGLSVQELTATAVKEALDDAGLSGQDVDAVFAGNAMVHSSQVPGTYTQLSKWTGTQFKPGVHFEAQCSTTNVGAAMAKGFSDPFDYWRSAEHNPWVAWPSRLLSLVTTADGASAMVLTRANLATGGRSAPVEFKGFGISYSDLPWYGEDPTYWEFDKRAADQAMEMAGITAKDIDYLHPHDCSHISGICTAETIGYLAHGKGLHAARDGRLRFDGDRPMSTHGGRHVFNRGPIPAKAHTLTMDDLPVLAFRVRV